MLRSWILCAAFALAFFGASEHLVLYAARAGEMGTAALALAASRASKRVYYPETPRGGFVAEDRANGAELPPAGHDVLFVVPGLAFDLQGARLGRGGGWYDRALARYPQGIRVGFAYDFQVVSRLPEDPWDLRMHAVVTDARLIAGATTSVGQ
jgi:5,10-methenyltetrahydrofolate synthetase